MQGMHSSTSASRQHPHKHQHQISRLWSCVQAQAQAQEARAREAAFQAALQEIILFKSRASAALLQAQERAESAQVSISSGVRVEGFTVVLAVTAT